MATYELPPEPDVDVIWTVSTTDAHPTVTTKWTRSELGWGSDAIGASLRIAWHEVLTWGVVHDAHPDLGGAAPTPWRWDEETWCVRDANNEHVDLMNRTECALAVRAVNAYTESLR